MKHLLWDATIALALALAVVCILLFTSFNSTFIYGGF
jgi:hypothetical protein